MSDLDYDAHKALVRGPIREQDAAFGDERLPPKFWTRATVMPDGCWEWIGPRLPRGSGAGYGRYSDAGKSWQAHRASYTALVGEIPADRPLLDHLCRNRACVRPSHLEPVTNRENTRRGLRPAQVRNGDMCRNGLHLWPESARQAPQRLECAECRKARKLKWWRAQQQRRSGQ